MFKTELAALAQQHFGPDMDARNLPGSWSSTANSLEDLAFSAKDVLLVVDDFAPGGSTHDVQRTHKEADRLLRAQGNKSGRGRMRANGTLRPARPPRGLVLSTGEDVPRGQSLRSRLDIVEMALGDIDSKRLTECQHEAANGLYAQALAGFVRWLAPQYGEVQARLRKEQARLRDQLSMTGQHARTPGIVADLALGLSYLLDFALQIGAISDVARVKLYERGLAAFQESAADQADHIAHAEPAANFLRLLKAVLSSSRAHVTDGDGAEPADAMAWGWREKTVGSGNYSRDECEPQGRGIGWLDDGMLWLEPDAVYAEAQEIARQQWESLVISPRTLWKRLCEKKLLTPCTRGNKVRFTRRTFQGLQREVCCIPLSALNPVESGREGGREGGRKMDTPSANGHSACPSGHSENGECPLTDPAFAEVCD